MSQIQAQAPVLSTRAMKELLRGNEQNFVSVRTGGQEVIRIHRPVAMRFSSAWKSALQNQACRELTVTFPQESSPAPPVGQATSSSSGTNSSPQVARVLTVDDVNKFALKLIVEWMEQGGAVDRGTNATPWPKTPSGFQRLLRLARNLGVSELVTRLNAVVARPLPADAKTCPQCKRLEHPGHACIRCFHCQELGHRKSECAVAYKEFLERDQRRKEYAEQEEERRALRESWRRRFEEERARRRKQREERAIRNGEMAVGDGGKTIWRWSSDI